MTDHIIQNILFDDLYIKQKYIALTYQHFFLNILDNKDEIGSLRVKYDKSAFFGEPKLENYFGQIFESDEVKKLDFDENFSTIDFENGYLKIAIKNIKDFYIYNLKKLTREKGVFGKDALLGLYKEEDARLLVAVDKLQDSDHLSEEIISLAVEQVYHCKDFINTLIKHNEGNFEKIPFNLTKVELLHLFAKLQEGKVISQSITPSELFLRMENYFLYSKEKPLSNLYNSYQEYKSDRKKSDSAMTNLSRKLNKIFPD
ncbi:hypothetical protein [Winogradskyella sediminis]|uniref:hypothetical protein n=1 Tax=Winogradskyella sediminis TaxID=1382466 RepID=UPI003AA7C145